MQNKQRPQLDKYRNIPRREMQANDVTSAVRKQTIERILGGRRRARKRDNHKKTCKRGTQTK